VLRLRGGAKKRKKKTYNVRPLPTFFLVSSSRRILLQTPKKIKHKRKKVKMAILKYYKVDSDGKIKRLRRECPTAECGAGIFVSFLLRLVILCSCSRPIQDGFPRRLQAPGLSLGCRMLYALLNPCHA
jgi:ribosomal protein S27AE